MIPYVHKAAGRLFLHVLVLDLLVRGMHTSSLRKAEAWRHRCTLNSCQNTQRSERRRLGKEERGLRADVQPRLEMRLAVAPPENVENSSLSMTSLFKICSHCERLSKKDLGVRIPRPLGNGPSRFIPEKEILKVSKVADRTQAIFEDAFSMLGRLDNVSVVMGFHPHYLESFLRTQHYLLQMDGPLSLHYRHYIGIMAAARHQCSYLVNLHVNDFLQVGGDPKWLNGLDQAPPKLQQLGELNKVLAHRPWLLTKEHIEEMCGEVEVLMERMKQLQECRDDEEASQEEMATRFEREKTESMLVVTAEDEDSAPSRDVSRHFEDPSYGYTEFSRRGEQVPTFRAQVRMRHSRSWVSGAPPRSLTLLFLNRAGLQLGGPRVLPGQPAVPRRGTDAGREVPAGLQPHLQHHGHAQGRGHQHAAPGHLELHPLHVRHQVGSRSALRPQAHGRRRVCLTSPLLASIRYDDYDYGEINQLLDRSFKIYIKTMVCSPEKTTKRMYESFWRQFQHSEKVRPSLLLRPMASAPAPSLTRLFSSAGPREFASYGSPNAGRTVVRSESDHPLHDMKCISRFSVVVFRTVTVAHYQTLYGEKQTGREGEVNKTMAGM
ncbi:unnamed protein product [Tetraodon nigroviridis]|uniref:(spotted green pufferfish) hypothetical protein n=1 Tax=Tetraodon nigroviridis TaxID=99883 RepID=Q4S6X1_TETNG|nr:unnamed protein product [Tetraodon nigroviridis]